MMTSLKIKPFLNLLLKAGMFLGKPVFKLVQFIINTMMEIYEDIKKDIHKQNELKRKHQVKKQFKKKPKVRSAPKNLSNCKKIIPDNTPLHCKRGWSQNHNTYRGYFRTRFGAWNGLIVKRADKFDVFIFNPPVNKLKSHKKWECFFDKGKGKYKIHLYINPKDKDVGAIIFYVEKIIAESFGNENKTFSEINPKIDLSDLLANISGR